MSELRFVWHEEKYERVKREHRVSYGEAVDALLDPNCLEEPDDVHWERSVYTGKTKHGRLLVVVCALEFDEDQMVYRLITAYGASKEKTDAYAR